MLSAPHFAKSLAYNSIIHPIMYYGCQVWNPHQHGKIDLLERVYKGPARWSCGSQWNPVTLSWSKSSEVCLTDLSWPTLLLRRQYRSIVGLYDIPHKRCPLNFTNCCTLSGTCTRKHALIILPSYSVNIQCILLIHFFVKVSFVELPSFLCTIHTNC